MKSNTPERRLPEEQFFLFSSSPVLEQLPSPATSLGSHQSYLHAHYSIIIQEYFRFKGLDVITSELKSCM